MEFLIIQLLGIIQLCACIIAIFQKEKKNLLAALAISNLSAVLIYFLGNSTTGVLLALVCFFRTIIYHMFTIKEQKVPFHLFLTLTFIILSLSVLSYSKPSDLLMICATLVAAYITYQPNMTVVRFGYIINTSCLIVFNLFVSAYVSAISETLFLTSTIISILKYDFHLTKKEEN